MCKYSPQGLHPAPSTLLFSRVQGKRLQGLGSASSAPFAEARAKNLSQPDRYSATWAWRSRIRVFWSGVWKGGGGGGAGAGFGDASGGGGGGDAGREDLSLFLSSLSPSTTATTVDSDEGRVWICAGGGCRPRISSVVLTAGAAGGVGGAGGAAEGFKILTLGREGAWGGGT